MTLHSALSDVNSLHFDANKKTLYLYDLSRGKSQSTSHTDYPPPPHVKYYILNVSKF